MLGRSISPKDMINHSDQFLDGAQAIIEVLLS